MYVARIFMMYFLASDVTRSRWLQWTQVIIT